MEISDDDRAEIEKSRREASPTRRPTVPALEELLFEPMPALDHGFVRVVDYMGDDSSIVQAARVSYGRGTRKVSEDSALIRYLLRHRHTTPFEMAEIKLHVKLPIFVARQWIRHRTASVNEYSARYSILDKEFYVPAKEHLAAQSSSNRQGRGETLDDERAAEVLEILRTDAETVYRHYLQMLGAGDDAGQDVGPGLARELARMNLSLNFYTQWYWKVDLHNFMNFLRLRADAHAQYEIRVYAERMLDVMKKWVPLSHAAFEEYDLKSAHLSATAIQVVRRMLAGERIDQPASGLPKREWDDLMRVLGR
ncbi:FAD-dependent thymidylate synthase [Bradyrhizobium sp. INPA01-394B]|uniref:Flavin-dependent thymidylate synthase n=1 Tax=Bradyrhizobium campsiandrae TaxID=1729892 RepID=A0ABR7UK62_9BRAD|nr:FAD-dependent thymidylate synthase [Bradyrhizobium campsiandrae]MBC9883068.1 FAD-dependent thymidylate synthase [Bradyrhizobium campsiandrae]MBC9983563.1 FAD-dependent thymidylate synthase [Bradyrhizobium campsiandrae]